MDHIGKYFGRKFGGEPNQTPEDFKNMSIKAWNLIEWAFKDIDKPLVDYHTHCIGFGKFGNGCCVNPSMQSSWNIYLRAKFYTFATASGIDFDSVIDPDIQYLERLARLIRGIRGAPKSRGFNYNFPYGKHYLLAFDKWYDMDGSVRNDLSGFHVPNQWVWDICHMEQFSDIFIPTVSIHPYRRDALDEIDKWGSRGVKMIKWLPNSMGIDPNHSKCQNFYNRMKKYNMVLLSHTGEEHSVDAGGLKQELGNPLLLRRPLETGVKVIAAHCGSEGYNIDFESEGMPVKSNYELWKRIMDDKKYDGLLFGDISAVIGFKRLGILKELLADKKYHHRLVNGSDYPVPAIRFVSNTLAMKLYGLITQEEREVLDEIFQYNPLLFDYVTKRLIQNNGDRFNPKLFMQNNELGL